VTGSASTPSALVDAAIRPSFDALKNAGFRRRGRTFAKVARGASGVLNFQSSQWNVGKSARFTINLAVYVPAFAKIQNRVLSTPPEKLEGCSWHTRIGFAMGMRKDLWWEVSAGNPSENVAADVLNSLTNHAIPWLERCMTFDGLCAFLADGGGVGAAELLWAVGRKDQAVASLAEMLSSSMPRYVELANAWLTKHGLRAP